MPDKKKSNLKKLLFILAGIIVIVIVISVVGGKKTPTPTTGLVTTTSTGQNVVPGIVAAAQSDQTEALVSLLREVSTLRLDNDIFLNPVFGALIDISSPLQTDQNPGRENPFLSIGDEGGADGLSSIPGDVISGGTTGIPETFFNPASTP